MKTAEKTKNLEHIASLRRTTITTDFRTPKIWYPMLEKKNTEKKLFPTPEIFFQQFFQPISPRREQEGNGWHLWTRDCYRMAVGIHGFVQLYSMSKWRAREVFGELLPFLGTTLKLRPQNGGDLEGNQPHQCVWHTYWVVMDVQESRNGAGRVAF